MSERHEYKKKVFPNGINVKNAKDAWGNEYVKMGIQKDRFYDNNTFTSEGWLNLNIKKNREGKWYVECDTHYGLDGEAIISTGNNTLPNDEEIPF